MAWLYVAGLYAAAVGAARRAGVDLSWRIALFFYALVLVFLWPSLTRDAVNLPFDFLKIVPPWSELTRAHYVQNPEMNDLVLQIVPWAHQVRESWKSLHLPLWNDSAASGYPLLANAQSAAFSIFRILSLPFSLGRSFAVEAALKILLALTFTWLFCRRRGYGEVPCTIGAIGFGFSTFVMIWLHFPLGGAAVFLPAVVFCADVLLARRTFAMTVFTALVFAAMTFCGHPETVLHVMAFTALYVAWVVFVERPFGSARVAVRRVLGLAVAIGFGLLIAAPLLIPFAEAVPRSYRYLRLQSETEVVQRFSGAGALAILVAPRAFARGSIPSPAETITGFAGILGTGSAIALLVAAALARRWRTREMFFVVMTFLVAGVMLEWPLFHIVTALFREAALGRLRLLLCFLLAVQTAAMVDLAARRMSLGYLCGILAAAVLFLFALLSVTVPSLQGPLPSMIVLGVALLIALTNRFREKAMLLLIVATIVELWAASRNWLPNLPVSAMYPETPLIRKLVDLRAHERAPFRIVGTGAVLFPNVAAMFGLEDIRAHDPMAPARYLQILFDVAGYDVGKYYGRWRNVDTPVLDFLNVKYVVTSRVEMGDRQRYRLVYDGADGRIFENTHALQRLFSPQSGTVVRIIESAPGSYRIIVEAATPSLVATSIPAWPGWKVHSANGVLDTVPINDAFLGFNVPAGHSDVRVWYSPPAFWVGVWIAVAAVMALGLAPLSGLSRQFFDSDRERCDDGIVAG